MVLHNKKFLTHKVENRLNMNSFKAVVKSPHQENTSPQLRSRLISLTLLVTLLSSCISFNSSEDGVTENNTNQNSNIPIIDIPTQKKIDRGMKSIKGHTFSLQNTILFSLQGTYSKEKLLNTQIVILNEDQNILTSLPASLAIKPITINIKGNKELYVKEIFNKISTITRLSVNKDSLNYGLKL